MTAETIERQLLTDLEALGERFADEKFSTALYRALTRNTWTKEGGPEGHVALSFSRAEEVVNELRARHGQPQLALAQSGDEGEVDRTVEDEFGRLGWRHRPLNTSRHDEQHSARPAGSPPPDGTGAERSPDPDPGGWAREGHAEAEANRTQ